MRAIRAISVAFIFALTLLSADTRAQSPAPIVIQAASASSTPAVSRPAVAEAPSFQAAIKALQELKSTNDETLKKQEATLQLLDDLQKAAEQLKIFSKRG